MNLLSRLKPANFNKRKALSIFLILVLLGTGGFFALRNFFKADTAGPFTISGNIYDSGQKTTLTDVNITISSANSSGALNPVSTKTDASGHYSLSVPDPSFTHILIQKDGFWDMEGSIVNVGGLTSITANMALKPGFGKEDIQLTAFKKTANYYNTVTQFGLSINPTDDKIAPVEIVPSGNSYKTNNVKLAASYDLNLNQEIAPDANNFQFTAGGKLPEDLSNSSAVYSPDTDKYYIIGGKKTDGSVSKAIYEYDRNDTANVTKVADLDMAVTNPSSVYLPSLKAIFIIGNAMNGTGQMFIFLPWENDKPKLRTVPSTPMLSNISSFSTTVIGDNLYYTYQQSDKSTLAILPISSFSKYITNTVIGAYQTPPLGLSFVPDTIPLTHFTPYYSSYQNKLYFLGGKKTDGSISDEIYQYDLATKGLTPSDSKLTSPISDGLIHKVGDYFYLFGGITNNNIPITRKMFKFQDTETKLSFSGDQSFKLPIPLTSAYASAEDNSNRTIIFSPNIQTLAPVFTYRAGQSYTINSGRDMTIVFRGRAKKDAFSFQNKDVPVPWAGEPTKFANPYNTEITVGDITFNYQNKDYNYTEATGSDHIIDRGVLCANYPGLAEFESLDQIIKPGDFINFWARKSGVKININPTGAYNLNVKLHEKGTTNLVGDADITLTSDKNENDSITVNPSHQTITNSSYKQLTIKTANYNNLIVNILNPTITPNINLNLPLTSGIDEEYSQIVSLEKGKRIEFGLTVTPTNLTSFQKLTEGEPIIAPDQISVFDASQQKFVDVTADTKLQSGQIIAITPFDTYSLYISGKRPNDANSFTTNVKNGVFKLTTGIRNQKTLTDYTINTLDGSFDLLTAAKNGYINPNISINSKNIDLNASDINSLSVTAVNPGDIFALTTEAEGVSIDDEPVIDPGYYTGTTIIGDIVNEMVSAGIPADKAFEIITYLNYCQPGYFSQDATDASKTQCENEVLGEAQTSKIDSKNSQLADKSFPKAEARYGSIIDLNTEFRVKARNSLYKVGYDHMVPVQWRGLSERDSKRFIQSVQEMSEYISLFSQADIMNQWIRFFNHLHSDDNLLEFQNDTTLESWWDTVPAKDQIFRKNKYWSSEDLDKLYTVIWPDLGLSGHRGDFEFSKEERRRLSEVWNKYLRYIPIPSAPNPGNAGILPGTTAIDDVFLVQPFSSLIKDCAALVDKLAGRTLCSMVTKEITDTATRNAVKDSLLKTGGATRITARAINLAAKDTIEISTPWLNIPGVDNSDKLIFDLTKYNRTAFVSRHTIEREANGIAEVTRLITEDNTLWDATVENIGKGNVNKSKNLLRSTAMETDFLSIPEAKNYCDLSGIKDPFKFGGCFDPDKMRVSINMFSQYYYDPIEAPIHEFVHYVTDSPTNAWLSQSNYLDEIPRYWKYNNIEEAFVQSITRSLHPTGTAKAYSQDILNIVDPTKAALKRIYGYSDAQAQNIITNMYTNRIDLKLNEYFNVPARKAGLISNQENFYDKIFQPGAIKVYPMIDNSVNPDISDLLNNFGKMK